MTTISAGEFNQHISAAKRAATERPLVITDHGEPSHVLMSYEEYQRLIAKDGSILDQLAMPEDDIEFDPPRLRNHPRDYPRAVDLMSPS